MKERMEDYAGQFASAIITHDYDAATVMLAPWLQAEIDPMMLKHLVHCAGCMLPPPRAFELDGNNCTLGQLRANAGLPIPDEITFQNFLKWMCIQFLPDPATGHDACFDLWMVMVNLGGAPRIGYIEFAETD